MGMIKAANYSLFYQEDFVSSIGSDFVCDIWYYSIHIAIFYVISIFSIQRVMVSREKFNLRFPLFCWNFGLFIFSALGVEASICDENLHDGVTGVWCLLFILSKAPELIDTYFIVLRKQKLIFLHWYHHITVFIYCWYNYCLLVKTGQWFIAMNYVVHTFMYGYYALRISRLIKLPIWVNMVITFLQLAQMVVGVMVNIYVYSGVQTDWYCDGTIEKSYFYVYSSIAMYFSYFVLFASFFYNTYYAKKPPGMQSALKQALDDSKKSTRKEHLE